MQNPDSLYNLASTYQELQSRDDLDPEAIKDTLDSINDSMADKIDNIASWIDSNNSDIDFLAKKIKFLQQSKKSLENKNKSLNQYIVDSLDQANLKKIKTDNHIVTTRNYRASTVIEDIHDLPVDYIEHVVTDKPKKTEIYQKLKAGEDVPGARLVPNRKAVIK
ncbi:siphovirus Gp157 family protein [Lentilactobacillus sp. G22-6]|uniref:siphovirus Gp157 family protein n=1 Tax=Lentilactobacillus dabitei TaxID=2831523 RepID=UPI001C267C4A|nr:siphovirus Gp157 family protein [Lentilactobacillus dabitei]MBU9788931.1 siphovirus Gp157 family protein [Lentilactobacillus dabitei]